MPRDTKQGAGSPQASTDPVTYPTLPPNLERHLKNTLDRRVSMPSRNTPRAPEDLISA